MKRSLPGILIPGATALLGLLLLVLWFTRGTVGELELRRPGLDRPAGSGSGAAAMPPPKAGNPVPGPGKPSSLAGSWPCFRGPDRDGIAKDGVPLATKWPPGGPKVLWRLELGPGHAGAAVDAGRVFVLDYDVEAQADTMRCLSLDDGREIWRNSYPVEVVEDHGMSRTVPAVAGDSVVSLGPRCHVACWDVETGRCRWGPIDLVGEFGAKVPGWYAGQCPLIDGDRVILAPSGDALMIAVDLATGKIVWRSPKVDDWEMSHVSIAPMEFGGRRMYIYCGFLEARGGVAGIAADGGSLLWQSGDWRGKMATCPTPVPVGDGRIFFSGGYGAGSVMLQLQDDGGRITPHRLFRLKPRQFGSEQQTPIFYRGHLYGVRTKPGGEQLACLDLRGNVVWTSGRDKFGRGPYLLADGRLYVLSDRGALSMIEATAEGYRPLDRFQVWDRGIDAWAPMALAAGRLILRDRTRMVCLDVAEARDSSAKPSEPNP